jgi:hypothetical protein
MISAGASQNKEARRSGLLTDTDDARSTGRSGRHQHRDFEKVPRGLVRTLKLDAMSFTEFGVLCFLILSIDHKTGKYIGRLTAIADELAWEHSTNYLSKVLRRLRNERWLEFEMKPGDRGPYVIRLGERYHAALVYGTDLSPELGQHLGPNLGLTSDSDPPSQSEVPRTGPNQTELATPGVGSDSASSQPRTSRAHADADADADAYGQGRGKQLAERVEREAQRPLPGDAGYLAFVNRKLDEGHITELEAKSLTRNHWAAAEATA